MSSQQKRRAPWQNVERHYCAVCNAWMGSDRQSIQLHENGKKHLQNVERALLEKRYEKKKEEQANKFLAESMLQMEQAALQATGMRDASCLGLAPKSVYTPVPHPTPSWSGPPPAALQQQPLQLSSRVYDEKQKIKEWQAKKKKREEEHKKRKNEGQHERENESTTVTYKKRKIGPCDGHYELDGKTYMEGDVFYGILEAEMPVQLWMGPVLATSAEKRLPSSVMNWKDALIVSVRKRQNVQTDGYNGPIEDLPPVIHVSYLATPDSGEETVEKDVAVDRIRIQLGADESIPNSLEEARLLAIGGEVVETASIEQLAEVDESTGLSGWSTVTVKKTTVRQYDKEEKKRAEEKLRQARLKREEGKKKAEERRLEEAKYSNADDSALGAFDVWGKGNYKGFDIS